MAIKHAAEYRDPEIARNLAARIRRVCRRPIRLMEVCGTHTMSIFRHGIRSLLPEQITLISGPGCPVCVTSQADIDAFVGLARNPEVIVTTFGDLMRVPGSGSSLQREKARGADVRVVYSTMDAVDIARANPDRPVVFLGVGFETTAPTIAAAVLHARQSGITNFLVYPAHKIVPPALEVLASNPEIRIDGFILPGHVSVIIGLEGYREFFDRHRIPCAVTGFEPADILEGILALARQIESGRPALENRYRRAVSDQGNPKARALMQQVFQVADAQWRGLGTMAGSGLVFRKELAGHDAVARLGIEPVPVPEPAGCACGQVLAGIKTPPQCALFGKPCTPTQPVGPCMVSSEGTCAAYYRYGRHEGA